MNSNFTSNAQEILKNSSDEAQRLKCPFIEPGHVVLAMLRIPSCTATQVLNMYIPNLASFKSEIEQNLRKDNAIDSLYNIVGFQTHLTYGAQDKVLKTIPGLENVEVIRHGQMHRNTYINSPKILNNNYEFKKYPNVFIAGQISGVEGYVESAAMGLYVGYYLYSKINEIEFDFPRNTMLYTLINYIIHANPENFAPMNSNYGIMYGANKNNRLQIAENSVNLLVEFKSLLYSVILSIKSNSL